MSNRQGKTLDFETLEQQRAQARKRTARRNQEKQEKQDLLRANRQKVKQKFKKALQKKNQKSIWEVYQYQITFGTLAAVFMMVIFSQLLGMGRNLSTIPVLEDEFIRRINEDGRTFKAKVNTFFEGKTLADVKEMLNNGLSNSKNLVRCKSEQETDIVDEKYNFANQNRFCVSPISDQQECGSAYAFASLGMFVDRYCKINNGLKKYDASVQHAIACDTKGSQGCKGGYITGSLELGRVKGFVTSSCMRYDPATAETCDVDHLKKCFRRKVESYCVSEGVENIKREIQKNGPVVSVIPVTREFLVYGSGIYDINAESLKLPGGQAVKIVGWGTSNEGIEYWVIENSWGASWGIKGYAKVRIGIQGSLLDQYAIAATPDNGDVIRPQA